MSMDISLKKLPVLYKDKKDCCGCWACYSICPKTAILMLSDNEGFLYPNVDEEQCIRCYRCEKICPIKREKR